MRRFVIVVAAVCVGLSSACTTSAPTPAAGNQPTLEERVEKLEKIAADHEERLNRMKRSPSSTLIVLSRTAAGVGACDTAKVRDYRVGNAHERHVRWDIETDCSLFGGKLELRFPEVKGQYPFPTQNIQARGGNRFFQETIKPSSAVDYGVFPYGIWLVPAIGTPKELADPELEVEPPPVIVASVAAPTNASPAVAVPSPPAKKQ